MGGGGDITPTSIPSSLSCLSEAPPGDCSATSPPPYDLRAPKSGTITLLNLTFFCESVVFADCVAISQVCDDEASDECCDCDDDEVEALYFGRRLQDRLREAKEFIRR